MTISIACLVIIFTLGPFAIAVINLGYVGGDWGWYMGYSLLAWIIFLIVFLIFRCAAFWATDEEDASSAPSEEPEKDV